MSETYKLIVFDWEGTLGDTLGHFIHTLNVEAGRMNLPKINDNLARQHLMLGLVIAIKKNYPELSLSQQEHLYKAVQQSLADAPAEVYLLPGAKELVKTLFMKGFELAIATNKGQHSLQRALQYSEMELYFSATRSAGQVAPKPCPDMLLELMETCGADPSETLMVGDSVTDIEMANSALVASVGVNFYHQKELEEDLLGAGALNVFDDFQQLASFLELSK
jgi:phosphoglycolate phosphatase